MDVTIIFFELLWNRRLLVALGWIDLCWSGGDDTSKLPSASTGHQTIGIAFTRNSVPALATGETQKIFDAYLSTAMLSSELRANLQFGEFNFFFAPETRNKKKRQRKEEELYTESDETALIYHASSNINVSNPEKEDCCNEGGEGVVKSNRKKKKKMTMEALTLIDHFPQFSGIQSPASTLLSAIAQSFLPVSNSSDSITATPTSKNQPFTPPNFLGGTSDELVSKLWKSAIEMAATNCLSLFNPIVKRTDDASSWRNDTANLLIAFAIYLYPYQFWSTHKLQLLTYNLMPVPVQALVCKFDTTVSRPIFASSWQAVAVAIYLEQLVLPVLRSSLSKLYVIMQEATRNQAASQFAIAYNDLQPDFQHQFGDLFMKAYGCETASGNTTSLSTLLEIDLTKSTLSTSAPFSVTNNERPFLDEFLLPLSAYFPFIVISNPTAGAIDRRRRAKRRVLMSPRAKSSSSSSATPNQSVLDVARNEILDIEDLGPSTAPACLERLIKRFSDIHAPFQFEDALQLLSALLTAVTYLTGSGDMGYKNGDTVSVLANREKIVDLVLAWISVYSPTRHYYILHNKKYGAHSTGQTLHGYLMGFQKASDKGQTYSRRCACSPGNGGQRTIDYICPYLPERDSLSYSEKECHDALTKCKMSLGQQESRMNHNHAPHPDEIWIDETVKAYNARRQRRVASTATHLIKKQQQAEKSQSQFTNANFPPHLPSTL